MIQYNDYDRITDILLYLSNNVTLNFNVILSRKSKTGERMFFEYETEYGSKYIGSQNGRAIKRNMSFYFSIEVKNNFSNSFMLKLQDVILLTMIIENQLLPILIGDRRVFRIKDKKLVIIGEFNPVDYTQSEYKFLRFFPIVCSYTDGTYKEGVRLCINSESEYVDMDLDRFFGFYYLLKNTDMYSAAITMCNYVKLPPHGQNIYSMKGLGGGIKPPQEEEWNIGETNENETNANTQTNGNDFLKNIKRKEK